MLFTLRLDRPLDSTSCKRHMLVSQLKLVHGHRTARRDLGEDLVRELEVLLDVDMLLDLEEDHWSGDHQRAGQKAPAGAELAHEGRVEGVHSGQN